MKTIERFFATQEMFYPPYRFKVVMSPNNEILDVQLKNGLLCFWVILSNESRRYYSKEGGSNQAFEEVGSVQIEECYFYVVKTREILPEEIEAPASRKYIGTVQMENGEELHVFKGLSV